MKNIRSELVFCLLMGILSFFSRMASAQSSWFFPLEIQAGMSSSFGEFRGQRVHAGVDLGTNMRTGYKVYAIADGRITRLYVRKIGYGNAVYITHANGLVSVYGHLEAFEELTLGLQTMLKKIQRQRGTLYPGDINLDIPVKRGQVIGYSGESGYGLPHLHFELRRGESTPIDPFQHGFSYPDQTPPVIQSLLIEPLGPQSFVDGGHGRREYRTEQRNGTYVMSAIPKISGKVRFTAAGYDPGLKDETADVDRIDLYIGFSAVSKIELFIDQQLLFRNQFNSVTYSTDHRGGLVYDLDLTRLSNPTQYYYRLYTLDPKRFPFREVLAVNNGVWDTSTVAEGRHTLTLAMYDANGNKSITQMQVDVEDQPTLPRAASKLKTGWQAHLLDFHDFLEVTCQTATVLKTPPVLQVVHKDAKTGRINGQEQMTLTPRGSDQFAAAYPLPSGQDGELILKLTAIPQKGAPLEQTWVFPVHPITAKQGGVVRYGENASLSFPAGALYENTFANIFPTTAYQVIDGLPVIGEVYDLRPAGIPLEKKAILRLRYPATIADPKKLGIFWWDAIKKTWYFSDDQIDQKTRTVKADIIYPSVYALLQDNVQPVIADVGVHPGTSVAVQQAWLSARITDTGKGIDDTSIVMTLDGKRVNGEYDPDRFLYKYPLTGALAPGRHTVTIQAADLAGNTAVPVTAKISVP